MSYQNYRLIATEIQTMFSAMDKENDRFSSQTGIKCVSTCGGVCCKNNNVEVSPIDLIPLVISLIEKNEIEQALTDARTKETEHCLFFKNGKCSIYNERATLCRLFGYSSVYNKDKKKVLSVCSLIKEESYKEPCPVELELSANLVDWSQRVKTLLPSWEQSTLPFNKAFIYAAERILLTTQYE